MARTSIGSPNTVERVRHDGGVSEATYVDGKWQSEDESLRMWLSNSAASGVEKALAIGCSSPGTEAKRRAEEAAKLAASPQEPVAVPE